MLLWVSYVYGWGVCNLVYIIRRVTGLSTLSPLMKPDNLFRFISVRFVRANERASERGEAAWARERSAFTITSTGLNDLFWMGRVPLTALQ